MGHDGTDLATGDLARRAGILARHATGGMTLLQKAGFINHRRRIPIGQGLQRIGA